MCIDFLFDKAQPAIHGSLQNQGLSVEGVPYVAGSGGFTVQEVTKVLALWFVLTSIYMCSRDGRNEQIQRN